MKPNVPYFSPRGEKIVKIIAVALAGYIVYRVVKAQMAQSPQNTQVQEAYTELDKLNQNSSTRQKISDYQAIQYANILFTAVDGYGTDEPAIFSVFSKLYNNADYLAVSKAFGVRTISTGRFNPEPNYKATMEQALYTDLGFDDRKRVNDILRSKGIKYKI